MDRKYCSLSVIIACLAAWMLPGPANGYEVSETEKQIETTTPHLRAVIRKKGYVSGVAGGRFLDRKTGFHDAGFGLDIVDFLLEPGSDRAYRNK